MPLRRADERGVILLLVLMVGTILYVIIGQFSWSMAMDGALARNHLVDAQARCDMRSAVALLKALVGREGESSFTHDLPTGSARLEWVREGGRFNLNNLRRERFPLAAEQLERLLRILEDSGRISRLGLATPVTDLVVSAPRPLYSLGELRRIEGVDGEVLAELSPHLTVHGDGLIDFQQASPEVLMALADGLGAGQVEALRKRLADPSASVPTQVAHQARALAPYVSAAAAVYHGRITISGQLGVRRLEAVLVHREDRLETVLFNELEKDGEPDED